MTPKKEEETRAQVREEDSQAQKAQKTQGKWIMTMPIVYVVNEQSVGIMLVMSEWLLVLWPMLYITHKST